MPGGRVAEHRGRYGEAPKGAGSRGRRPVIRVFVVDDHELVRRGVADLLEREHDIEVVGEADSARQVLGRVMATEPDVVLLDVHLPDGNGIDLCRAILERAPDTGCLMLTAYDDEQALYSAVLAGAMGYVLKDIRGRGLIEGVRKAAAGRSLISAAMRQAAAARLRGEPKPDPRFGTLTAREREVLSGVAEGLSNRQIGMRLGLAEKTVKNHMSSVLSKLGLQSRTQAALLMKDPEG
jgi:DNA-binding NarL/FixJ family response regulator